MNITIAKTAAGHIKIKQDSNLDNFYSVYSPIKFLPTSTGIIFTIGGDSYELIPTTANSVTVTSTAYYTLSTLHAALIALFG
jgi:hypothetical protein